MKKFENLGRSLTKSEQREIGGGTENSCSVTCDSAYYACCCAGVCKCIADWETGPYGCTTGGPGSSSCTVTWNEP